MADVVVEVEVGVVDPVRMVETERHFDQAAAHRFEPTDQGVESVVGGLVRVEVGRRPFVDRQAVDMAVGGGRFHVQETGVESGQLLHVVSLAPIGSRRHRRGAQRVRSVVEATVSELHYDEWMSESDSVLWHIERDPLLRSTITSVWFLDSVPDRRRMDAVVERIAATIPRLRQRVVDEQPGVAPPRWMQDPNFDVDYHYSWARLPGRRVGRREVLDHAQRLAGRSFDKDRPLWELCVIEGLPGKRAAFVMKVHHAIADGLGLVQLLAQMVDLEADPTEVVDSTSPRSPTRIVSSRHCGRSRAPARSAIGSPARRGPEHDSAGPRCEPPANCCATRWAPSSNSGAPPARSPESSSRRPRRSAR